MNSFPGVQSGSRLSIIQRRSSNPSDTSDHDFDTKGLGNELTFITRLMESHPKKAITRLKQLLKPQNDQHERMNWIHNWVDTRGLDLLQNAIVHNQDKVVEFLLNEANLFPPHHHPKLNPYAHTAAYLGHFECMVAILDARPSDYFAASNANHAVKLPPGVNKKLKLSPAAPNKAIDRLLLTVKRDTEVAEHEMRSKFHSVEPDEEIRKLKASVKSVPSTVSKAQRTAFDSFRHLQTSKHHKAAKPSRSTTYADTSSLLKLPLHKRKNKITVFWDVFSDNTLDRFSVDDTGQVGRRKEHKRVKLVGIVDDEKRHSDKQTFDKKQSIKGDFRQQRISSGSNTIELGIRRIKKYKDFVPVLNTRAPLIDDPKKYMGKTPLTYAAERKHYGSVTYLLNTFHFRDTGSHGARNSLTLAASARSPEAIAALMDTNVRQTEYQSAVLLSLRELYPDTLSMLLNLGTKNRAMNLFDGVNLYHTLYTQCLQSTSRIEMLPEMTRILLMNKEDVNAKTPARTFPIYGLIRSAFSKAAEGKVMAFAASLKLLLQNKANPNFDEKRMFGNIVENKNDFNLSRPLYRSAIHCVFINAQNSIHNFDNIYWSQIIMQKLLETIEEYDKTPRKINNEILFYYMSCSAELGLNRRVLRMLLRYGANPDYTVEGKYSINVFFDNMMPFMTRFQVDSNAFFYGDFLGSLLVLSRAMSQECLHRAVVHFLDNNFMSIPLQALDLVRQYCYHANQMITSPRTLAHLAKRTIWIHYSRNSKTIRDLRIPEELKNQILP